MKNPRLLSSKNITIFVLTENLRIKLLTIV
nr:MAG TPA: hypothetical protein [Caudoviricetes sp.]